MLPSDQSFRLPDTLAAWPWPRRINPHYAEVNRASAEWLESFHAFDHKSHKAFNACDFGLLAALAYPLARKACDLMNALFVIDEYTDLMNENETQAIADIVMDALRNPLVARPPGESIIGEMMMQFWARAIKDARVSAQRRFISTFDTYMQSDDTI